MISRDILQMDHIIKQHHHPHHTRQQHIIHQNNVHHHNNVISTNDHHPYRSRCYFPVTTTTSKECRVCGDKALGFNFNGLTCESCKAFFRRNAYDYKLLSCQKGGHCPMDKHSRKYCRKCRLDKCFEIGMKKELISRHNQTADAYKNMDILNMDQIAFLSNEATTDLKIYELTRLQDVHSAIAAFTDENTYEVAGEVTNIVQLVNLAGWNIKEVIKFCKNIPAFNCLSQGDQLIMLKNFFPEKTSVRCAFLYNVEKDGWIGVESEFDEKAVFVKMEILKEWTHNDIFSIFRTFVYCLHVEMENDEAIRDLILVQLLFKSRPKISRPEYLRYHYLVYSYLLRRYLEHKYSNVTLGATKYQALMFLVDQIDAVSGTMREVYAGIQQKSPSTSQVGQVLAEIYNLL